MKTLTKFVIALTVVLTFGSYANNTKADLIEVSCIVNSITGDHINCDVVVKQDADDFGSYGAIVNSFTTTSRPYESAEETCQKACIETFGRPFVVEYSPGVFVDADIEK